MGIRASHALHDGLDEVGSDRRRTEERVEVRFGNAVAPATGTDRPPSLGAGETLLISVPAFATHVDVGEARPDVRWSWRTARVSICARVRGFIPQNMHGEVDRETV